MHIGTGQGRGTRCKPNNSLHDAVAEYAAAGQRFWQIDALRGLALLNMLVYHAMYDWVYIFGHASGWYDIWSTHCHVWQQYICWSFILLSGYSFTLSRRPLKNGLLTAC